MKKIIILLILSLSTTFSFAQIKEVSTKKPTLIGEIKIGGLFFMDCQLYESDKYVFSFRDLKYQQITELKSFSFQNIGDAFNEFYKIISKGISKKDKIDKTIELPEGIVILNFNKKKISFHFTDKNGLAGISQYFNQKQIADLFGKKD